MATRGQRLAVVIKGILGGEDARMAVEAGAAGVMVSNHGGRQLDHVPGTIDALDEVVDAVGGSALVAIDGGVRQATDVLLALAVGADVVALGRPVLFALAHGGSAALEAFLSSLVAELQRVMTLAGVASIKDVDRSLVRRLARLAPLEVRETAVTR